MAKQRHHANNGSDSADFLSAASQASTLRARSLRAAGSRAFTVIELMLAIAIMGVIVFTLYGVFNQVQKAMRSGNVQADISEKARAVMEMVTRELEQAHPTFMAVPIGYTTNLLLEVNMFGGPEYPPQIIGASDPKDPQRRTDIQPRTNYLHNLFFLTHFTNAWQPIGYRVVNVSNHVGSLMRYDYGTNRWLGGRPYSNILSSRFHSEPVNSTNYHHIADGVIHFSVIPYDRNGYRLGWDTTNRVPGDYTVLRRNGAGDNLASTSDTVITNSATVILAAYPAARAESLEYGTQFTFRSNAMPAYIDLQLGMLEPETLSQYYLMLQDQNPNATNFLARQISKVHLFRQRIPIRTAAQ